MDLTKIGSEILNNLPHFPKQSGTATVALSQMRSIGVDFDPKSLPEDISKSLSQAISEAYCFVDMEIPKGVDAVIVHREGISMRLIQYYDPYLKNPMLRAEVMFVPKKAIESSKADLSRS